MQGPSNQEYFDKLYELVTMEHGEEADVSLVVDYVIELIGSKGSQDIVDGVAEIINAELVVKLAERVR